MSFLSLTAEPFKPRHPFDFERGERTVNVRVFRSGDDESQGFVSLADAWRHAAMAHRDGASVHVQLEERTDRGVIDRIVSWSYDACTAFPVDVPPLSLQRSSAAA